MKRWKKKNTWNYKLHTLWTSSALLQANVIISTNILHRVSQEERSIFWEVIVSVILSKNVYMNMCPILNGFRDRDSWLYSDLAWTPSIGVPGGKVNILEGHSIGHTKRKCLYDLSSWDTLCIKFNVFNNPRFLCMIYWCSVTSWRWSR